MILLSAFLNVRIIMSISYFRMINNKSRDGRFVPVTVVFYKRGGDNRGTKSLDPGRAKRYPHDLRIKHGTSMIMTRFATGTSKRENGEGDPKMAILYDRRRGVFDRRADRSRRINGSVGRKQKRSGERATGIYIYTYIHVYSQRIITK